MGKGLSKTSLNHDLLCDQKIFPVMHKLLSLLCSAQSLPWCNIFLESPHHPESIICNCEMTKILKVYMSGLIYHVN
jgi:hypothetical protein